MAAQDNQICTLKGSMPLFTFLEHLDLSNNVLRNLAKQLEMLEKFAFLKHLNLKGNPLCEEPDYRLITIHAIPSLQVLDQHVVTAAGEPPRPYPRDAFGGWLRRSAARCDAMRAMRHGTTPYGSERAAALSGVRALPGSKAADAIHVLAPLPLMQKAGVLNPLNPCMHACVRVQSV